MKVLQRCGVFLLISAAFSGCRGTDGASSESPLNSVTAQGFAYDSIQVSVHDSDGLPLEGVGVGIFSSRWTFEVIGHDPLVGIPGPGRGWIWKSGEGKELGRTAADGVMTASQVVLKARGVLPGQSPAGIELFVSDDQELSCPNGTFAGNVHLNLSKTASVPAETHPQVGKDREATFTSGCSLRLGANEDTFATLRLDCKSSRTSAAIAAAQAAVLQSCH